MSLKHAMKAKQSIQEDQQDNIFKTMAPDQQSGIFSHDRQTTIESDHNVHLKDLISPAMSDDVSKIVQGDTQ